MGYHIFMARKVQLTSLKNSAYSSMMNQWIEQEHIADEQLSLMTERNDTLAANAETYKNDRDSANREYNNYLQAHKAYQDYQKAETDEDKSKILEDYQKSVKGEKNAPENLNEDVDPEEAFKETHDGKSLRDYLADLSDDYKEEKEKVDNEYSVDYQLLSDQENRIEQAIQVLETHISEYTEEMSKVEQQEATEIKVCIPNYNGAGGGQG